MNDLGDLIVYPTFKGNKVTITFDKLYEKEKVSLVKDSILFLRSWLL
jgi:hypothetical protein